MGNFDMAQSLVSPARAAEPTFSIRQAVWKRLPIAGWAGLALLTAVWVRMILHALELRQVIEEHESIDDTASLGLSDKLIDVGADYFYPFTNAMFVVVAVPWAAAAFAATQGRPRLRKAILGIGAAALVISVVFLSSTLSTYVNVTE